MDYLEDDEILEQELSLGVTFNELKSKLKKELIELESINQDKKIKEIIIRMNNILE